MISAVSVAARRPGKPGCSVDHRADGSVKRPDRAAEAGPSGFVALRAGAEIAHFLRHFPAPNSGYPCEAICQLI
jgi:hypothetical protein